MIETQNFKSGYVAIIGKPNAGKSTFLNVLIGEKLAITTSKPQTTRHKIVGIYNDKTSQIIFLDTPGIIKAKYKLHSAISDADVLFHIIDVEKFSIEKFQNEIDFKIIKETKKKTYLILNKSDLTNKIDILPIIDICAKTNIYLEIFPISALHRVGVNEIIQDIKKHLPSDVPFYMEDDISIHPQKFFVSELIREQIFYLLRDEIPYSTTIQIVNFQENENFDKISAEIIVDKKSLKQIVIGNKGSMLKNIGIQSRKEIEKFLNKKIFLELFVKVRENWREDEIKLKEFGYK